MNAFTLNLDSLAGKRAPNNESATAIRARRRRGFTLIEMLITVAVTGVLAGIAYPAFGSHVMKARRADALVAMMQVQMAEERWRSNAAAYGTLTEIGASSTSPLRAYTLAVGDATAEGYRITAAAAGYQAGDTACRYLVQVVSGDRVDTRSGTDASASNSIDVNRACWGQR